MQEKKVFLFIGLVQRSESEFGQDDQKNKTTIAQKTRDALPLEGYVV